MAKVDDSQNRQELITRLSRLEGQVRGVKQMLLDERKCDDILIQVSAIINSLRGFSNIILKDHIATNMIEDLKNGKQEAIDEMLTLFNRVN